MQSLTFVVALATLLVACACAPPKDEVIQKVPENPIPLATGKSDAVSGAGEKVSGASDTKPELRVRREVAGQESDLLPSGGDVDASPFGETSQLYGHGRIKVLPAYLG